MAIQAASCSVCGWPARGASCEACGARAGSPGTGEDVVNTLMLAGPQPEDFPGLKNAFLAWKQKDYPRMIGQCLVALGVESPQVTNLPAGPGWSFVQDSAVVYLSLERETGEVSIESPLVRLVVKQRVPMLRTLLELNSGALGLARLCLRDDLVILRFADRLENLSPPKLVGAIREVALNADKLDDSLSLSFSAKMLGPEARRHHMGWQFLGTPRKLRILKSADAPRVAPPLSAVGARAPSSTSTYGAGAGAGAPASFPGASGAPLGGYRRSQAPEPPSVDETDERLRAVNEFYELLRTAKQALQPLLFGEKAVPAVLLARATVFRACDELGASCGDATALLLAEATAIIPAFWQPPIARRGLEAVASQMNHMFETILRERRQGRTHDAPPVERFKTALEAKTHLRALADELARGPTEHPYRHFVHLGVFSELLVRAPLPAPMVERLRAMMAQARSLGETVAGVRVLDEALKGVVT